MPRFVSSTPPPWRAMSRSVRRLCFAPPSQEITMSGENPTERDETTAAERVLSLVGSRAEAIVHVATGTSSLTRFANSRIHQNVTEDLHAVHLTVISDGRMARAGTTRTEPDALAGLVERALAAAALRPADPDVAGFAPPAPVPAVDHWDEGTAAATPEDRARVVAAFVDAAGELEAAGYCSTRSVHHVLVSSTG